MPKNHRREKKSSRRVNRFSAEQGGPLGCQAGRPYNGNTLFVRKEWFARPVQEMIPALWFLGITALLPGWAMPEIE
jgi:hypothetical protein